MRQVTKSARGSRISIRNLRKLDCLPQNRCPLLCVLLTSADYGESPVSVPQSPTGPLFFTGCRLFGGFPRPQLYLAPAQIGFQLGRQTLGPVWLTAGARRR